MSETITLTDASFPKKANRSQYAEFISNDLQAGKRASVYAYVKSTAIGCVTDGKIEIDNLSSGKIRIVFYTDSGVMEFFAEDVTDITYCKNGGIKEWEIKTKYGISFEIVPK